MRDRLPIEMNLVITTDASVKVFSVRVTAVPDVGERIQIEGQDYRVESRDWVIDFNESHANRCLRVVLDLDRIAEGE